MLGGLLVWAVHFMGIYAIASVADLSRDHEGLWTVTAGLLTLSCLAALAPLYLAARAGSRSGKPNGPLTAALGQIGAIMAAIAIIWQTLPWVIVALTG